VPEPVEELALLQCLSMKFCSLKVSATLQIYSLFRATTTHTTAQEQNVTAFNNCCHRVLKEKRTFEIIYVIAR
jgi:hypothetical protein